MNVEKPFAFGQTVATILSTILLLAHVQARTGQEPAAAGPALTLADIERMAEENNPTLAQAEAAIRAAQGRRRQAGLFPNPTVGYQGEELAFRAFNEKSEHFFFVEQTIPLGGKLGKGRLVFEKEVAQAEAEAAAQKQRVLNTVRMLYFEALSICMIRCRMQYRGIFAETSKFQSLRCDGRLHVFRHNLPGRLHIFCHTEFRSKQGNTGEQGLQVFEAGY